MRMLRMLGVLGVLGMLGVLRVLGARRTVRRMPVGSLRGELRRELLVRRRLRQVVAVGNLLVTGVGHRVVRRAEAAIQSVLGRELLGNSAVCLGRACILDARPLVLARLAFRTPEVNLVPVANAAAGSNVLAVVALDVLPSAAIVAAHDIVVVSQVPAVQLADFALQFPRLAVRAILDRRCAASARRLWARNGARGRAVLG